MGSGHGALAEGVYLEAETSDEDDYEELLRLQRDTCANV
jgi:hypothetical protein